MYHRQSDDRSRRAFDRRKLPHVDAGQLLGQGQLLADSKRPVRKVVGNLPDKVMLLQRAGSVLEDRVFPDTRRSPASSSPQCLPVLPNPQRCAELLK